MPARPAPSHPLQAGGLASGEVERELGGWLRDDAQSVEADLPFVVPLTWADDPSGVLRVALGVPGTFEESAGFGAASELTEAA
jgi:hypothetical protein